MNTPLKKHPPTPSSRLRRKPARIVCISDTHSVHASVDVPDGDILVHAGDCTHFGHPAELVKFLQWFTAWPHRHKILIAGNHDWMFEIEQGETAALMRKHAPSVHYLNDSGVKLRGLNIWGSPVQPVFLNWAFSRQPGPEMRRYRDLIPADTDVLVTHCPPRRILDLTPSGKRAGCVDLRNTLPRLTHLRLAVFGHLHLEGGRQRKIDKATYVNAAICDEAYRPVHQPVVVDLGGAT